MFESLLSHCAFPRFESGKDYFASCEFDKDLRLSGKHFKVSRYDFDATIKSHKIKQRYYTLSCE